MLDEEAKEFMPELSSLPTYENIDYRHTQKKILFFQSNSVVLVVGYDESTYQTEKEKIFDLDASKESFSVGVFDFKLTENKGFPKSFGLIGTSDEKQAIAYLYFYDSDLDNVNEPADKFIRTYFDYDF